MISMKVQAAGLVVFMCHGEAGVFLPSPYGDIFGNVTLDAGKYDLYYISLIKTG